MTRKKSTNKPPAKSTPKIGRVRLSDDSMKGVGIRKGDVCHVGLNKRPVHGKPCVTFTAEGKLLVRIYLRRKGTSAIELARAPRGKVRKLYDPDAVIVFGPVVKVEKAEAGR